LNWFGVRRSENNLYLEFKSGSINERELTPVIKRRKRFCGKLFLKNRIELALLESELNKFISLSRIHL
jgi:hypothetical protein